MLEGSQARQARRESERTYARSVSLLRMIVALGLFTGLGATVSADPRRGGPRPRVLRGSPRRWLPAS